VDWREVAKFCQAEVHATNQVGPTCPSPARTIQHGSGLPAMSKVRSDATDLDLHTFVAQRSVDRIKRVVVGCRWFHVRVVR